MALSSTSPQVKVMENDIPVSAGSALSGKEEERRLQDLPPKPAMRKGLKKSRVQQQVGSSAKNVEAEDATAGDEFYVSVLERFGIQI
jgi:hypothetical protein